MSAVHNLDRLRAIAVAATRGVAPWEITVKQKDHLPGMEPGYAPFVIEVRFGGVVVGNGRAVSLDGATRETLRSLAAGLAALNDTARAGVHALTDEERDAGRELLDRGY